MQVKKPKEFEEDYTSQAVDWGNCRSMDPTM